MFLYGPNLNTNVGDDVYDLSNLTEYTVLYDAGGEDTISFVNTSRDVVVALPTEQFRSDYYTDELDIAVGAILISPDTTQDVNGFLIGEIENVATGGGNDAIIGNKLDNIVRAGAGDDNVMLSRGSDIIYGGDGADTFLAQHRIEDFSYIGTDTIIKDFEIGIDTLIVSDGSPELVYSRNEDGYATYTSNAGVNVVLEGIEANVLLIA